MKVLLLVLSVFTISHSALASNGWSSSGGGEYIIDRNNPWFMGDTPVTWCIDHGGEDKFSLSLQKSKIEIEKAIDVLSSQLKHINQNDGEMAKASGANGTHHRKCGLAKNDSGGWEPECYFEAPQMQMSDTFTFVSDCSNADMEFILGNYNNEKIQTLIKDMGLVNFKNLAGIAIRTSYSQDNFRGKGFIYIAADKGDLQYSGPRNLNFNNNVETIWDTYDKIDKDMLFPKGIRNDAGTEDMQYIYKLKLKDYTVSTFLPVVAHEFGHVLGFGHNHYSRNFRANIMDEDYPADIISTGLVFKGNFLRESMILSRGLIETRTEHRIGFEWGMNRVRWQVPRDLATNSPNIYKFLYDIPASYKGENQDEHGSISLFLIFDIDAFDSYKKNHVQIATYEKNKLEYKIHKNYEIELGDCSSPSNVESINLRSTDFSTIPLLSLENTYFCGTISLGGLKNKSITFKLSHIYYQNDSELELYDTSSPTPFRMWLTDSDIFGYSNSTQKLSAPMPAFSFK